LVPSGLRDHTESWLERYQAHAGNLLMVGPRATVGSIPVDPYVLLFPLPATYQPCGDCGDVSLAHLWPFSAWCLETVDLVRPAIGSVFGEGIEPSRALRTVPCDAMYRALAAGDFFVRYPDAIGAVVDLAPTEDRRVLKPEFLPAYEEFYNVNVTSRPLTIEPRPCQVPMYRLFARRDEPGVVEDPDNQCPPSGTEHSVLDGVPVAIASTTYAQGKPLLGSADFLWGFHPLSFEPDEVASALRWIFTENWQLTQ
jgi:hypothetical protein